MKNRGHVLPYVLAVIVIATGFETNKARASGGQVQAADTQCLIEVSVSSDPIIRVAMDRIRENCPGPVDIRHGRGTGQQRSKYDLTLVLGTPELRRDLDAAWGPKRPKDGDAFLVKTLSREPLVIALSGIGPRGTMYAAYRVAELLETEADLTSVDIRQNPTVKYRYALVTGTTHGGRQFRPMLFYNTIRELPRYGFNGVVLIPGSQGATPVGRKGLPLAVEDGRVVPAFPALDEWRLLLQQLKAYGMDIMVGVPTITPPEYEVGAVRDYYSGRIKLAGYEDALRRYSDQLLTTLLESLPEIDAILFNSTEGAIYQGTRIFDRYQKTEEAAKLFDLYLNTFSAVLRRHGKRLGFWTHQGGITNEGLRAMREVLFRYPEVTIVEDDRWPGPGWLTLPVLGYLPDDLRETIHKKNPFGMFLVCTDAEFYGAGSLPTAAPAPFVDAAQDALRRNAEMVLLRLDLHDRTRFGTLFNINEIIPLSAAAQLWEPTPDPDRLWERWVNRRFGKRAAPFVTEALRSSEEILKYGFTLQGTFLLQHSAVRLREWSFEESDGLVYTLPGYKRYSLFAKPGTPLVAKKKEGEPLTNVDLLHIQAKSRATPINEFRDRQRKAAEVTQRALRAIAKAKPFLSEEDYTYLHRVFDDGRIVLGLCSVLAKRPTP